MPIGDNTQQRPLPFFAAPWLPRTAGLSGSALGGSKWADESTRPLSEQAVNETAEPPVVPKPAPVQKPAPLLQEPAAAQKPAAAPKPAAVKRPAAEKKPVAAKEPAALKKVAAIGSAPTLGPTHPKIWAAKDLKADGKAKVLPTYGLQDARAYADIPAPRRLPAREMHDRRAREAELLDHKLSFAAYDELRVCSGADDIFEDAIPRAPAPQAKAQTATLSARPASVIAVGASKKGNASIAVKYEYFEKRATTGQHITSEASESELREVHAVWEARTQRKPTPSPDREEVQDAASANSAPDDHWSAASSDRPDSPGKIWGTVSEDTPEFFDYNDFSDNACSDTSSQKRRVVWTVWGDELGETEPSPSSLQLDEPSLPSSEKLEEASGQNEKDEPQPQAAANTEQRPRMSAFFARSQALKPAQRELDCPVQYGNFCATPTTLRDSIHAYTASLHQGYNADPERIAAIDSVLSQAARQAETASATKPWSLTKPWNDTPAPQSPATLTSTRKAPARPTIAAAPAKAEDSPRPDSQKPASSADNSTRGEARQRENLLGSLNLKQWGKPSRTLAAPNPWQRGPSHADKPQTDKPPVTQASEQPSHGDSEEAQPPLDEIEALTLRFSSMTMW